MKMNNDFFDPLNSVRIKITDKCPWECWFCHNEGSGKRSESVVLDIQFNDELLETLDNFKTTLGITELHLTGGEPTCHHNLPFLVSQMKQMGFVVKMTSIGSPAHLLDSVIKVGLDALNLSFPASNPEHLLATQLNRDLRWAQRQFSQQIDTLTIARQNGLEVKLNTVVANRQDLERILGVINWAQENQFSLRLMNELSSGEQAIETIFELCQEIGAIETYRRYIHNSSAFTVFYVLPNGYQFGIKLIRDVHLDVICKSCENYYTPSCSEKFYGIRLESKRDGKGIQTLYVRLCLHHSGADVYMPISAFFKSQQFKTLRELAGKYKG